MATVIQNLACFEVTLDAKSGRYYFDEDILKGKKINQIWLYFSTPSAYITSPLTDKFISQIDSIIDNSGVYLNIVDLQGKLVVKNLALPYLEITSENNPYYSRLPYSEININNVIDTKNSYFNSLIDDQNQNDFLFLMYVSYTNEPLEIKDNNVKGSFSVEIPIPNNTDSYDVKLSNFIPKHYRQYPIKKIIITEEKSRSFLDLKADNKYIENIPNNLLFEKGSTKEVFFDNLKIDYEESYIRYRGGTPNPISDENEKITFIY